jgi:hypothetical protein
MPEAEAPITNIRHRYRAVTGPAAAQLSIVSVPLYLFSVYSFGTWCNLVTL